MPIQTSVAAAPAIAFAGMLADDAENDTITMVNQESTGSGSQSSSTLSTSMPFGVAVVFMTSSPVSDLSALFPHATTDLPAGITVHKHNYERQWLLTDGTLAGELDARGVVTGISLTVLRRGRIWVSPPMSVTPGQRLYVRAVANGAISYQLGSCENAADASNMIACTTLGQWLTSCSTNGFAKLEVDFTVKPG